ncbi:MAG: transcriptional regulator [Limisphaerales bacterium]
MPATTVLSLRLPVERAASLKRLAKRLDRSAAETAARLVDEGLRREEFAMIEFRDSPVGRQAYLEGTRVAAWQVVNLARGYDNDAAAVARHLSWPESKVRAALSYAGAFPDEIEAAIEDGRTCDFTRLSRTMSALERIEVPAEIVKGR